MAKYALKGQKTIAQDRVSVANGTLGRSGRVCAPCKGKRFFIETPTMLIPFFINAFALTGRIVWTTFTQGAVRYAHSALGYGLVGFAFLLRTSAKFKPA